MSLKIIKTRFYKHKKILFKTTCFVGEFIYRSNFVCQRFHIL